MSQLIDFTARACQDPLAINCPSWCIECPNYDPELLVDWNDGDGQPYQCHDSVVMHDPYLLWTQETANLGAAYNCIYDSWCPSSDCQNPHAHQTFQWFENKTASEFNVGYCNNSNRHIQSMQSKIHTLIGMQMSGTVISPSLNNPLPHGKSMSVMSSISGEGTRLVTIAIHWWSHDILESQLILPHETFSQERPYFTFYGEVPDHLCMTFSENVSITYLPEPVPKPCDPDYTIQIDPNAMNFCNDGIGKGGFKGKSRAQYEETGGFDCTQPDACDPGGYCYYMKIHPDDYPDGGYTFDEDCIMHQLGQPFRAPVCINSAPEMQCNWCENPACPDISCTYDWLWCCFDIDYDGECDTGWNPVNYCCGETCGDCYSGQDLNDDGIDDGEQMLDLDSMMPPDSNICFDGTSPIFCCPDKKPADGVCDDSYNPNLWELSCSGECPDKHLPIDFDLVNDIIQDGIHGCNDPYAWNFHPWAFIGCESGTMSCCDYNGDGIPDDIEDGFEDVIYGCTFQYCDNYNPDATVNTGNCCGTHELCGPTLPDDAWEWQFITECGYDCTAPDALCGCTDPVAMNYDSTAIVDDDSCRYEFVQPVETECLECKQDIDCRRFGAPSFGGAWLCDNIDESRYGCCVMRSPAPEADRQQLQRALDRLNGGNNNQQTFNNINDTNNIRVECSEWDYRDSIYINGYDCTVDGKLNGRDVLNCMCRGDNCNCK